MKWCWTSLHFVNWNWNGFLKLETGTGMVLEQGKKLAKREKQIEKDKKKREKKIEKFRGKLAKNNYTWVCFAQTE